jgi:spermidine synthase
MADDLIIDIETEYDHYTVMNTVYNGRPSRMLYTNKRQAAQSGLALDEHSELLFDYNERFMDLARGLQPKNILLIGGGAFTFPKAVNENFPNTAIDIVELDKSLLDIAKQHFYFEPNDQTRVFIGEGQAYLQSTKERYDLIVLDVFNHTEIPRAFQTLSIAKNLNNALRPSGLIAMNIIAAYHGERSATLKRQTAAFQSIFTKVEIFPAEKQRSLWLPQNFILTARNYSEEIDYYLRYGPLSLPKVTADDIIDET